MIPQIIHYCWFGRGEKPDSVLNYIATWKKVYPQYQIMEWNEDNFDVYDLPYTREAYKLKMYAFVSDVARLYALDLYGGIYLDTDVELIKPFDDLFDKPLVLGFEAPCRVGTAVICADKNNKIIKGFLNKYNGRHFISARGHLDITPNTSALSWYIDMNYLPVYGDFKILPIDYFCAKAFPSGEYLITDNTRAVHHFAMTWHKKKKKGIKYPNFLEIIYQTLIYPNRIEVKNLLKRYF